MKNDFTAHPEVMWLLLARGAAIDAVENTGVLATSPAFHLSTGAAREWGGPGSRGVPQTPLGLLLTALYIGSHTRVFDSSYTFLRSII